MENEFVWVQSNFGAINLSKVRNFTIDLDPSGFYIVIAWFSNTETSHLGRFKFEQEATDYLASILKPKKGGAKT